MSTYQDASKLKQMLTEIISEVIENHPLIKMAYKGQKVVVWEAPDTTHKTVQVKLLGDILSPNSTPLTLPYKPIVENYLINATPKQTTAWITYTNSINSAVVDDNGMRSL